MKRTILLFSFLVVFVMPLFSQISLEDLLEKNRKHAVILYAGQDSVIYRIGFGVYLKNGGSVLTVYNNIVGFNNIKCVDSDGDTLLVKGVIGVDKTADLVLLDIGKIKQERVEIDYNAKIGPSEKVYVIGVDPRNVDTVYSGVVTEAYMNNDGILSYNISSKMIPGYEGGLVFNEQMKLLGITKGIYRNNYFSGFLLPITLAKKMIENPNKKIIPFSDSLLSSGYNVAYWRGIYASEKGVNDYQEAIAHFKIALQEKPGDVAANFQIGITFGIKHMLDSAIFYYKEAVGYDKKFTLGYLNLAVAYIMKEDFKNAISTSRDAVKLNPQFYKSHFYLAYALLKNKQYAESIKSFKKAVEIEPNDPSVLEQFAEAYYLNKKYRDAIKTANQALKLNPNASNAIYVLGVTNLELGDRNEAQKAYYMLDAIDKMKANMLNEKLNGK